VIRDVHEVCIRYSVIIGGRGALYIRFKLCILLSTILNKSDNLLIIPKENFNGQPSITADLEAFWHTVQLLQLLLSQIPPIELKVRLNAFLVDRLGNNRPSFLNTPCEQYLLRSLSLCLG
jgi:hypothetical protein